MLWLGSVKPARSCLGHVEMIFQPDTEFAGYANHRLVAYTQVLLAATPSIRASSTRRKIPVSGELPNPLDPPSGCVFHTRCPHATERCRIDVPEFRSLDGRLVACPYAEPVGAGG